MVKLIKKLFIKNYQMVNDAKVRVRYGVVAGGIGIFANVLLFIAKLVAGILSFSIAVIADAINNLSDFMTSIVTIIGFKLSGQPADKKHPYGHARFEYVTGLIVACIIFFIGIETGRSAIDKIISGETSDFTIITIIILSVSVLIKLCLSLVFKSLAKSINSDAIYAMATDSRNDAISTSIVLICAVVGMLTDFSIDGYLGVAVSVFVLISAIKLISETINPLIGTAPDKDLIKKIENKLKSYPSVLDIHDLIVHNYGPTKTFATVHIEVDSTVDIMISHDLSDNIERDFYRDMNVNLVCHLDPVNVADEETSVLKETLCCLLKSEYPYISLHDFRIVSGKSHTNVIFDVVIPFDAPNDICDKIQDTVNQRLAEYDKQYYAVIEFDRNLND